MLSRRRNRLKPRRFPDRPRAGRALKSFREPIELTVLSQLALASELEAILWADYDRVQAIPSVQPSS